MSRYKYTFLNPDVLAKIDARATAICTAHNVRPDVRWQVWCMTATLMLGKSTELRFDGDGIANPYWSTGNDPIAAYGGYYRMDKGQQYGYSAYLIWNVLNGGRVGDTTTPERQAEVCRNAYSLYDLVWESAPMQDGYRIWEHAETRTEALHIAAVWASRPGYRGHSVEYSADWMQWRVTVWSTRKHGATDVYSTRIPAVAPVAVHMAHTTRSTSAAAA